MITVLLQGPSESPEQLNFTVDSYLAYGYKDIIVSTYSRCLDSEYLKDKATIIINDQVELQHQKFITDNFPDTTFLKRHRHRLNVNLQIDTTYNGVLKALDTYPDNKFILKQRADTVLLNLSSFIDVNLGKLANCQLYENPFLEYRFFGKTSIEGIDWYTRDFIYLAYIEDLRSIFNIPKSTANIKPEQYILTTYARSKDPNISWKEFRARYLMDWVVEPKLYWMKREVLVNFNTSHSDMIT